MRIRSDKSEKKRQHAWQTEQERFVEATEEMHPIDEDEAGMNKLLKECIERLKDEQKRCICLFYFEERSYKEISVALKLEEKKVKSFIQNGKRNLKICLEGKGG